MKPTLNLKFSYFMAFLLTGLLTASLAQAQDVSRDVNTYIDGWLQDYNRGNIDGLANRFTNDAALTQTDGSTVNGKANIKAYFDGEIKATTSRTLTTEQTDILALPGDYAQVTGTYAIDITIAAGTELQRTGYYTSLLHKENGEWKMVRHFVMTSAER